LSTNLPKTTLSKIYSYGLQSLANRRKTLIYISFLFILIPRLTLYVLGIKMSTSNVEALYEMRGLSPIQEFMAAMETYASALLFPTLITVA
jgi:hypothetical protein